MLKFIDYHYANSLFFYRRIDGYGERVSASAATFFYSLGLCMILVNVVQQITGSLAPLARHLVPAADKPYNNAAEYLIAVPFAMFLHHVWLWRRTPLLSDRYAVLGEKNSRLMVGVGTLLSLVFAFACGYGRVNFSASLAIAGMLLLVQEVLYLALVRWAGIRSEA
jgi:hypothetical protein